jgi:hypothetical protein
MGICKPLTSRFRPVTEFGNLQLARRAFVALPNRLQIIDDDDPNPKTARVSTRLRANRSEGLVGIVDMQLQPMTLVRITRACVQTVRSTCYSFDISSGITRAPMRAAESIMIRSAGSIIARFFSGSSSSASVAEPLGPIVSAAF